MNFEWLGFLEQRGIDHDLAGKNVGRGEVGVQCPFCGHADPSKHMAVNLEGKGWVCRRNRAHAGRSPIWLVRALLGCSLEEARAIVGVPGAPISGNLADQVESLLDGEREGPEPKALRELSAFKRLDANLPSARPYVNYMIKRGFSREFLRREATRAGLRYCTKGPFAGRIIFLLHRQGKLVGWTGRSIRKEAQMRYRALSADPGAAAEGGLPQAIVPIERCLLWGDELAAGGAELFLVEGPMDALKLRALGRQATCVFTASPSRWQVDLLREIASRFVQRVVLLDRDAVSQTLSTARQLVALGFRAGWLPAGADDPGELTEDLLHKIRT